jgi:MFS superfamily sulfate permease-like transporter
LISPIQGPKPGPFNAFQLFKACKPKACKTLFKGIMENKSAYFKTDILAGVVVFLVALPLCLGIALASGAPLFAGVISGVIGGILVGVLSGSQLSVSGPAAGLTAIRVVVT